MKRFTRAVGLGVFAGVIDVLPMLIMAPNGWAITSAFAHWVVLGVLIAYLQTGLKPWLNGLSVGLASAVPVALMVWPIDPKALGPIIVMSAILGAGLGFASGKC